MVGRNKTIFLKKQGLHVEMDAGRVVVRNQVIVLLLNYYLAFYWGPVASQYLVTFQTHSLIGRIMIRLDDVLVSLLILFFSL